MEKCFAISSKEAPNNVIGVEANYSVIQQSIIADLTCLQMFLVAASEAVGGNAADSTEALNTFLSRAKAGSVEVEFEAFSLKDNPTMAMSGAQLFAYFKRNAINKAAQLGCMIDICDDCSIKFLVDQSIKKPLIVINGCGTSNSSKETIYERGGLD